MKKSDLFETIISNPGTACILWQGATITKGYGQFWDGTKMVYTHIKACERRHGPKPSPRHQATHICNTPLCCNPRHMKWATNSENQMDRVAAGTSNRGEAHGLNKLTEKQARVIKNSSEASRSLAYNFGVSQTTVIRIKSGKEWAWL